MTEETRAAEYRAAQKRREAAERDRLRRLRGSPTAAQRVRDGWAPIVDFLRELREDR